jgi:hypothetical protein
VIEYTAIMFNRHKLCTFDLISFKIDHKHWKMSLTRWSAFIAFPCEILIIAFWMVFDIIIILSAHDFNISRVFSNVRRVLSQYKTWLSLLYLLYDMDFYHEKLLSRSSGELWDDEALKSSINTSSYLVTLLPCTSSYLVLSEYIIYM